MPSHHEQSARTWFEAAERAYAEGHQACANCGGRHQVYQGKRGSRQEYYCPGCDFYTFHDETSDQFFAAPGHEIPDHAQPEHSSTAQATRL
jgi:hypothetical protein